MKIEIDVKEKKVALLKDLAIGNLFKLWDKYWIRGTCNNNPVLQSAYFDCFCINRQIICPVHEFTEVENLDSTKYKLILKEID